MTKQSDIESRLRKLEKGPDKKVLAIMEIRSRTIAGSVLKQIPCQELKDR